MKYEVRKFDLPELKGLSKKQTDVHLSLYEGYVKHVNLIMEKISAMRAQDAEANAYAMAEVRRRLGFEFDGMRMHEYYFEQFEGGFKDRDEGSALSKASNERYGEWGGLIAHIKEVAGTRGIGWVVVYYDAVGKMLHTAWVNDHEIGQLGGLPVILALDLWEHAYMVDYLPAEKKNYIDAFFDNFNWSVAEARFDKANA
jgi:Fe-Mn family superoxide dismutase